MSNPRKFLIMVAGRPEDCGDADKIKWKELPANISRVMRVLNSHARRAWGYSYRSTTATGSHVYDEDGKIEREKTAHEILAENLTAFGQGLCNAGISREVFDKACSDLKEYEGHVFTVSKSISYRAEEVIKYNAEPMVGYPPNMDSLRIGRSPYTGHKKGLAEKQFHLSGDLSEHADFIFGAVNAQELATKQQQNSNYIFNIGKGVENLKHSYRNLMANINTVAARRMKTDWEYPVEEEEDYLEMYEQSTPNEIHPPTLSLHLRWVIEDHIHNSLRHDGINSPTIRSILALRFNTVPYHENIGYDERERLKERCKESMVFGLSMWSMTMDWNHREPCPRNEFEASADAVTNEEVQAERDDALDEWAQNLISVCRFPHPEVMSPSTKEAQEAILTEYIQEANKYTTILRAIFVRYADLIEVGFRIVLPGRN